MALIIGARTASGRRNVGKSVELFGLCQPGQRFVNPVNGVMTQLPATADRALWLGTGDVYAFDNQHGFAFVRAEHRKAFHSETIDFAAFSQAYREELAQHKDEGLRLATLARQQTLTLLYAAKNTKQKRDDAAACDSGSRALAGDGRCLRL